MLGPVGRNPLSELPEVISGLGREVHEAVGEALHPGEPEPEALEAGQRSLDPVDDSLIELARRHERIEDGDVRQHRELSGR